MAFVKLVSGQTSTNGADYTTDQFSVATNQLILVWVVNVRVGLALPGTPVAVGPGLNLEQVSTVVISGSQDRRLTCFRAVSPATPIPALTLSFIFAAQQSQCSWSVFEYDDFDLTGPNGAGAVLQPISTITAGTMLSLTLAPLADAARSAVVGGLMLRRNRPVTPSTGLTVIDTLTFASGAPGTLETADRIGGGEMLGWSWTGDDDAAAIALEIKPASVVVPPNPQPPPSTDDPELLARQFEPIIFFHELERFFPSDAKRYVEHCALWKAETPFGSKDDWGGKGLPFDRQPIIAKGDIAAVAGEPGTRLDDNLVQSLVEERFLELGGWRDASGMSVPGVTATSMNTFSNRNSVAALYNNSVAEGGDQTLVDSRFWYHAELIGNDQLTSLLPTVFAPDLAAVLKTLENAALLNYYFFFPGHDESITPTCTNIEAVEFGCFGGEWACFSVLLERSDPAGSFRPTFVGMTGRQMLALPPSTAEAADTDDFARRTVMRVSPFSALDLTSDHPTLFASNGTHSLYPKAGLQTTTYPAGLGPLSCGRFEGPPEVTEAAGLNPNPFSNPFEAVALWLAKIAAGSAILGVFGAPIGAIAGVIEVASANHGLDIGGGTNTLDNDKPAPEETGAPGMGKVVKPASVTLQNAGTDVQDWASVRGMTIGDRHYDFVVDRETQLWWPMDDSKSGYQGRWGPRVEHDNFVRRSGMRMPVFWRMFFLAFAKGKDLAVF